jgi:pantoate--beta-alanine ligase
MKIFKTFKDLLGERNQLDKPIGFVPTMGFLHQGHLSLVKRAKADNKSVVVSIFVNPTQFSPNEDLDNYPKDLTRDFQLLEDELVDLVWVPEAADMYPDGYQTWVDVEELTTKLEGKFRPTHFRGVTTVVSKLFNGLQPDRAYFGQKDAQQVAVIQRMVRDLNYPIEIVVCPIIREADGLAMSSRNVNLDPKEREAARCISRGLNEAHKAFQAGERNAENLRQIVKDELEGEKLARVQYISCADPATLEELDGVVDNCLLSLAVYFGTTRLIDNINLTE